MPNDITAFLDPSKLDRSVKQIQDQGLGSLVFARNFCIGPERHGFSDDWSGLDLGDGLVLSAHPALPVCQAEGNGLDLVLIGHAVSPDHPDRGNAEIAQQLAIKGSTLEDLLEATARLSGRWAMLATTGGRRVLFGDAWGSLATFYGKDGAGRVWIASSPKILAATGHFDLDSDFVERIAQKVADGISGGQYPFDCTPYRNVRALLPNHLIELASAETRRFWPVRPLESLGIEDVAEQAAEEFADTIEAFGRRSPLTFGLTGGRDSRLVLAAAVARDVDFASYTGMLESWCQNEDHFDVRLARAMSETVGSRHAVFRAEAALAPGMTELFDTCSYMLSWSNRRMSAMMADWPFSDRLHLMGWGSEINRCFWDIPDRNKPYLSDITGCLGFGRDPHVAELVTPWFEEAQQIRADHGILEMDLLYWEARLGRWAADSLSEMNLVQTTIPAFSNRAWFERVLGATHSRKRRSDEIYSRMTRALEPRLANFPINPFPLSFRLKHFARSAPKAAIRGLLKTTGLHARYKAL